MAIYKENAKIPAPGGAIERFFLTAQSQFESEVRNKNILNFDDLNRAFSAWLSIAYLKDIHSDLNDSPENQYEKGLGVIRTVDLHEVIQSFMQKVPRKVHEEFSDAQLIKNSTRLILNCVVTMSSFISIHFPTLIPWKILNLMLCCLMMTPKRLSMIFMMVYPD